MPVAVADLGADAPDMAVIRRLDTILFAERGLPRDPDARDDARRIELDLPPFIVGKVAAPARLEIAVHGERRGVVILAGRRGRAVRTRVVSGYNQCKHAIPTRLHGVQVFRQKAFDMARPFISLERGRRIRGGAPAGA